MNSMVRFKPLHLRVSHPMSLTISPLLVCCALAAAAGCQTLPQKQLLPVLSTDKAPQIPLRMVSASSNHVVSLSDRLWHIDFSDERPDSERRYYPGLSHPLHWQDAISMLPMEAFDPGIEEQIRVGISERGVQESSSIRITLTSFQFTLDEREETRGVFLAAVANSLLDQERKDRERAEREEKADQRDKEQEEQWKKLNDGKSLNSDSTPPSSLKQLPGELFGELFGFMIFTSAKVWLIDTPVSHWHARKEKLQSTPAKQQTPESITREKRSGLNCQIEATITRTGNERHTSESITVIRHMPRNDDMPLQAQIADVVEESIDEFCDRVAMMPEEQIGSAD